MTALILGHSYIRNIRDFALPPRLDQAGNPLTMSDVDICQSRRAARLALKLSVQHHVSHVYTLSNSITFISDLQHCVPTVTDTKPTVVVIDIGSNDISYVAEPAPDIMLDLATEVFNFAKSLSVPCVVLHAVLPRTGFLHTTSDIFYNNSHLYNTILHDLCKSDTQIHFNKLRGFHCQYVNNVELKRPVSDWSTDGIHPNKPASTQQYLRRLSHGLLDALKSTQ